jgi:hypothetical protein
MKLIKILLSLGFIVSINFSVASQVRTIVGSWQLVKQSSCLEEAGLQKDSLGNLRDDMRSRSASTAQVVSFKKNSSGEESSRILNKNRSANPKKFFYKFNGDMLLILDKKSQTISNSYMVDKFTADSLIVSDASRPCETKVFIKIKEDKAN